MEATQQRKPAALCFDPNWKYIKAVETDIVKRFKSMGWTPPSELREVKDESEKTV